MKCPSCGIPLSSIEEKCPACEADLTTFKKSRRKKLIISLSSLAILIVILLTTLLIIKSITKYDGKYSYVPDKDVQFYLDELNYTLEDLNINYYIVIKSNTFEFTTTKDGNPETVTGEFSIEGEDVTLKGDDITYKGKYDKDTKTITIIAGDSSMTFKKSESKKSK